MTAAILIASLVAVAGLVAIFHPGPTGTRAREVLTLILGRWPRE